MIKINRTPKPQILVDKEADWLSDIKTAGDKKALEKAKNKYQHAKIKKALVAMLHGKCAFCESYIENVDFGDIEHFKPKSKFPLEAVVWENLLLSCKKCNGAGQKGDAWPTVAEGGLLIDPTVDDPDDFFDFEFDSVTEVTIVKPKNSRGVTSEQIYGLNKLSLVKDRNINIKRLVALAQYYHTDPRAKDYLNEAIEASGEYSAFAKMVKSRFT